MDKLKKLFQTNGSRKGSYSILLSVIVFGILLVVNLLIGQLPEKIRKIDISDTNIYEISSKSRKLVKNLDSNIIFYIIAEKDNTDDRIKTFVNKYAGMSEKIKVQWIDPVLHPSALT